MQNAKKDDLADSTIITLFSDITEKSTNRTTVKSDISSSFGAKYRKAIALGMPLQGSLGTKPRQAFNTEYKNRFLATSEPSPP